MSDVEWPTYTLVAHGKNSSSSLVVWPPLVLLAGKDLGRCRCPPLPGVCVLGRVGAAWALIGGSRSLVNRTMEAE